MPIPDSYEMFRLYSDGSERAIEELFHRCSPMVYGLAYSILRSHEDAEDAVQGTWMRFLRQDITNANGLVRYLGKVAKSEALDILRKRKRKLELRSVEDQYGEDRLEDLRNENEFDVVQALIDEESDELMRTVANAINGDVCRQAFILREIEGLSPAETKEIMRIKKNAANTATFRGREEFRRLARTYPSVQDFVDVEIPWLYKRLIILENV